MKISVVIPSFNNSKNLSLNLPKVYSALKEYGQNFEIIVTDDASTDDSAEVVKSFAKEHSEVNLLKSGEKTNQGFSTNVNKGVRESKGEILVLLNTDVEPTFNFL